MSGDSTRSNLIDVTYQELQGFLSGDLDGTSPEQLAEILRPRIPQLRNLATPFGTPSDASKKKVDGGSVTLPDKVVLRLEDSDKEFAHALSAAFAIDQVDALILLRSFLYNHGLPDNAGAGEDASLVDELVELITPFYYAERLALFRILNPLLRAFEDPMHPAHPVAAEFLPLIAPDGAQLADALLVEYLRKVKAALPAQVVDDPKGAARWTKQSAREQLVLLEDLFWALFSYVSSDGPMVVRVFEAAYATELGSRQENAALLLDAEGAQLQQDAAAVWIVIMLEVLELERVAEAGHVQISVEPTGDSLYTNSPASLTRLHELIISNSNSHYACVYLAWAFVLHRLSVVKAQSKEIPAAYQDFFRSLPPKMERSYAIDADSVHRVMAKRCLDAEAGLFQLMYTLLTSSPIFVTSVAWKTGSSVTDPNAVAFRSVLKGLLIGLIELVPVEEIPDFDAFLEVWNALFERSEPATVAALCAQYWQEDWPKGGLARRAVLDVARARFPVQARPLASLLRALAGAGFRDTDPLRATADSALTAGAEPSPERQTCAQCVFGFLDALPTFTHVIPTNSAPGLYERVVERAAAGGAPGVLYTNTRALRLPGGSVLPARSTGRQLSGDGGEFVIVAWAHRHSGWKVVLEILTDYVHRRHATGAGGRDVSFGRRRTEGPVALTLEDVGVGMDPAGDEELATSCLELVRTVVQDDPVLAERLLRAMESGDPVVSHTSTEAQPPDLVQLATMILEDSLSRGTAPCTPLVTAALGVLAALLALPRYAARVWLYARSTAALFGTERAPAQRSASTLLSAERVSGQYTMTLALLHLVQQLFHEASASLLAITPATARLQQVKEEVLLRAARFVHSEIWVEHSGWKYAQLGDRFEIGRRISTFFAEVLIHASPILQDRPFVTLSQAVADVLLYRATTSTITPLVTSIASAGSILATLLQARRFGDGHRLIALLHSHLTLTRIVLNIRQRVPDIHGPSLLEQALCARSSGGAVGYGSTRAKIDHIDVIASYIFNRAVGPAVPLEATWVLHALCASLSSAQPVPPTIAGHLADPEATIGALVRIVAHPYDDPALRNAVWDLMALAVRNEPALSVLLVTGALRLPDTRDAARLIKPSAAGSAFDTACDVLAEWKDLWELNPHVLACILGFLDAVWDRELEHRTAVESRRQSAPLWASLASIAAEELGPTPDYKPAVFADVEGVRRSELHEAVSAHAYRTVAKAHAVHIVALDIQMHLKARGATPATDRPASYKAIQGIFRNEEQLTDHIAEAVANMFDPALHDEFSVQVSQAVPTLKLQQLQTQDPLVQREFGDDFLFSVPLLERRLHPYRLGDDAKAEIASDLERQLVAINLNLSLAQGQTALTKSWQFLLQRLVPYLRGDAAVRRYILALAGSISGDMASEVRSGELMAAIHSERLALLLALLEVAWFSTGEKPEEIPRFITLVKNVRGIVLNGAQDPAGCFVGQIAAPFHRSILQMIYFCARQCTSLARRPKALNAEQRLSVSSMVDASLSLVINALRVTFDIARSRADLDVDKDMELLVTVFEQCTQADINPSSTLWLARCQEADVIRASLELFARLDLVGLSDIQLLQARGRPLYAPHVLSFHTILASMPSSAERLVSDGLLTAYANNDLSAAISAGAVDVTLPELPSERSPAHTAYCSMLAVVAGVVASVGRQTHFLAGETGAFVQLYADQIARALSWTIGDTLTLPLLEELERTIGLFYAVAESTPHAADPPSDTVVKVLRLGSAHSLMLLQQLNYALTHPNHIASLMEPVTSEERVLIEADARNGGQQSASEHVDPIKRPFLARLLHRLFRLTNGVLATLISISRADMVMTAEPEDWPLHETLVVPHSKVVLGEPASLGTLLELCNCALDVLRRLSALPAAGQALTPAGPRGEKALDVRESIGAARRTLEAGALYAVAQLAMWVARPELEPSAGAPPAEMDMDEYDGPAELGGGSGGGARKAAASLADRLRRGMTGEMAADLLAMLNKARPVLAKAQELMGEKDEADFARVLATFVQEHVAAG